MPDRTVTSSADFDTSPRVEHHRFRGRMYTFTELPISEYDKLTQQATTHDEVAGTTRLDEQALMKLLVLKCVDISPREYAQSGTRVILALNRVVRAMHYGEEPEELVDGKDDEATDAEGEAPGNVELARVS